MKKKIYDLIERIITIILTCGVVGAFVGAVISFLLDDKGKAFLTCAFSSVLVPGAIFIWGLASGNDSPLLTPVRVEIENISSKTYEVTIKAIDVINENSLMISVTGETAETFTTDNISYKAKFSEGDKAVLAVTETTYENDKSIIEYTLEEITTNEEIASDNQFCGECGYTPEGEIPNFCPDCGTEFAGDL